MYTKLEDTLRQALAALEVNDARLEVDGYRSDGATRSIGRRASVVLREQLEELRKLEPHGWVRMNPGFKTGVFHLGAQCPPGWLPSAKPVWDMPAPAQPPLRAELRCDCGAEWKWENRSWERQCEAKAPAQQQAAMLDWSDIGRLMDAVHFAGTQGFTTGTTNWVVAVSRYMAKPSPHEQVGPVPAQQPLTDEQIDRAIAELGLNYFADAANNRAVLRVLCRRAAHGITGSTPT